MFLTKDDLKLSYGVHLTIGAAYVDRKVPKENLYWKNRTIYLPGAPGYIFMPIFTDLLFRAGADHDLLTSEKYFQTCESILHRAALHEHGELSWKEHIREICSDLEHSVLNKDLYNRLLEYLYQERPVRNQEVGLGTAFPSLNRADSYLFALATFESNAFDLQKAIDGWYALMTYFLLLDDLADIKEDLVSGQENVLIDAGLNEGGEKIVARMIDQSISIMESINPVMSNRIEHKKSLIDLNKIIQSIRQEK